MKKKTYQQPVLNTIAIEAIHMMAESVFNEVSTNTEYVKGENNKINWSCGKDVWDEDWSQ